MNIRRIFLLVFSSIIIMSTPVLAADYYWTGGTGSWDDPNNWSPYGIPSDDVSTHVYLTNAPGNNATAYFTGVAYPDDTVFIGSTQIYGTGSETMTLQVSEKTLGDAFIIGNNGVLDQISGTVFPASGLIVNSGGVYNLSGGISRFTTDGIYLNSGVLNQTGGTIEGVSPLFVLNGGVYNLSGTGTLICDPPRCINVWDGGIINQYGGSIVGGYFSVASNSTYNMYDGNLNASIYLSNSSVFNQSGGIVNIVPDSDPYAPGSFLIGADRWGGNISESTYNLSGGSLTAIDILNHGTINYSGGELHLGSDGTGILTNYGTTNLSGSGTRTIDGNIINNGTFKTTNTIAYYTGTFTNNGAYISDPSTQYFNDLIIGQNGYLVGQLADVFKISSDLISSSIMNTDWNTKKSYLQFITGTDGIHDFFLTGGDFGAKMSGYANNFAWGTLDVTGNIVNFFDGNSEAGAALYLREIFGLDITDTLIANLFGFDGLDIYYMANLPGNEFLHGLTYNITGGGYLVPIGGHRASNPELTYNLAGSDYLAPIPTPEPGTMLLLVSGLLGLVGYGRRRMKREKSNQWN